MASSGFLLVLAALAAADPSTVLRPTTQSRRSFAKVAAVARPPNATLGTVAVAAAQSSSAGAVAAAVASVLDFGALSDCVDFFTAADANTAAFQAALLAAAYDGGVRAPRLLWPSKRTRT